MKKMFAAIALITVLCCMMISSASAAVDFGFWRNEPSPEPRVYSATTYSGSSSSSSSSSGVDFEFWKHESSEPRVYSATTYPSSSGSKQHTFISGVSVSNCPWCGSRLCDGINYKLYTGTMWTPECMSGSYDMSGFGSGSTGHTDCPACLGGACPVCNGMGYTRSPYDITVKFPCDKDCSACDGRGWY